MVERPVPELSVVVTVVEGEPALSRCLDALAAQVDAPAIEVVVPYDATVPQVAKLADRYPRFRFIDMGRQVAEGTRVDPFVEHELFDRRRAVGLRAARAPLVSILEDRGAPRSDWARAMVRAHAERSVAAVGGGVINVAPGAMRRALFACDFGRHSPPYAEGEAEYLTDINICYRREALESVADVWRERYQETAVNWALRDRGETLWLSASPLVLHERGPAPLAWTLSERLQWGRVFGIQRGRRWSRPKAVAAALAAVALPALLTVRQTRLLLSKGARVSDIAPTVGALLAVTPAWALGEAIGYIEGAGKEA